MDVPVLVAEAAMADDGEGRNNPPSAFAESLRMWRQRLGWTQEDLSEASGLSTRAIRSLERGRILRPRRTTVQLLADALQVPRTRLLATMRRDDRPEAKDLDDHGGDDVPSQPGRIADPAPPRQLPGVADTDEAPGPGLTDPGWLTVVQALRACRTAEQPRAAVVTVTRPLTPETALRAAHHVADVFPDGQLYADLGDDAAISAQAILRRFLRALEVHAAEAVPTTDSPFVVDELAALLRSRLADRRVLILVDNVASGDQIRPLISAAPGCALLVTSRAPLDLAQNTSGNNVGRASNSGTRSAGTGREK